MKISECRERDAIRMARRETPNPDAAQIEKARHALRLFYRFAAAYSAAFYTEQDRTASAAEKVKADEKSEKAYKRAAAALAAYGLKIECPGLYPIIDETSGANFTHGHYYT